MKFYRRKKNEYVAKSLLSCLLPLKMRLVGWKWCIMSEQMLDIVTGLMITPRRGLLQKKNIRKGGIYK